MFVHAVLTCAVAAVDPAAITAVLQDFAEQEHQKWNMSLSVAFYSPKLFPDAAPITVAAGFTNEGLLIQPPQATRRKALPDDVYVWGSTTKMFTGPAVLQLVDQGKVDLEDPITKHIDPWLMKVNGTKLEDHFEDDISQVVVRHLLHMTSGIGDYDRESYSSDQFAHPDHDYTPVEILTNYVPTKFDFAPGSRQDYCSANYILLGMILANYLSATGKWQDYDQKSVIPAAMRASYPLSKFADKGACSTFTPVHGIMAPSYYDPSAKGDTDVWNVSCVGGWTGGNYVGPVGEVARYTYALYAPPSPSPSPSPSAGGSIVSAASQAHLTNFTAPSSGSHHHGHSKFYGMATFSLDWTATTPTENVTGYGHVGDTYGYQTTYFPGRDFVITVATNIESANQAQPAETTCLLYHALAATLDGTKAPTCSFTVPHRFIGECSCGDPGPSPGPGPGPSPGGYKCEVLRKQCVQGAGKFNSKAACESECK